MKKKAKSKKNVKVVPKYLPLIRSSSEIATENIFIYASVGVITVALTILFIALFSL